MAMGKLLPAVAHGLSTCFRVGAEARERQISGAACVETALGRLRREEAPVHGMEESRDEPPEFNSHQFNPELTKY
jgi:hypothetical protein